MFSYWEKNTFLNHQDFIIIGGGFVGLWTAIELKQKFPLSKVTILERGLLPTGASTKNAGFSCFGSPTELIKDAEKEGEDAMWNLVEKRFKGIRKIQSTFKKSSIDYQPCGGYECLLQEETKLVANKIEWLNNGLKQITHNAKTFQFSEKKLASFELHHFDSLAENKMEGSLHPAKLIQQLHQKTIRLGVQIMTQVEVTHYSQSKFIQLETKNNICFTCNQLIICTNAFAKQLLPAVDVSPRRGQVLLTNELPYLSLKGCFHYDEGFYYFRNVGKRLLLGGARNTDFENEETDRFDTSQKIQDALLSFVKKHILPNKAFTVEHTWSGIMGFGNKKIPIIKEIDKNVFCAVRMSGMGVALAPIVAEEIVSLINY